MISEKDFATSFGGFWSECLAFLTPQLVGEMNLAHEVIEDWSGKPVKPFSTGGDNTQNDFIAETAFELFIKAIETETGILVLSQDKTLLAQIATNAITRLIGLQTETRSMRHKFPEIATTESIRLAKRMEDYFASRPSERPFVIQPRFKGCGILDSCYGDILAGSCLYESKMVDRNLRSSDLRQLLIYSALNSRSQQYNIDRVAVLNVRRGTVYEFNINNLALQVAKKSGS